MGGEEDNANDLPYRSEYAKSGRAKCKGCKVEIPKGDLRLASMTQVLRHNLYTIHMLLIYLCVNTN